MHVPWARNNEYYHFFTHLKRSPMKLRIYKSNPNITLGLEASEYVKVTLLLDPQCTFTISVSSTWYHRLAQIARNYSTVVWPYMAAVLLLATRSNILSLKENGKCMTMLGALKSEGVKPYYALVCARLGIMVITSVPFLTYIFENACWSNTEVINFSRSLLVIPAYMTALGILHVMAAAVLAVMVFSSQLAHRLFFRIVWRGGTSVAERVASGLQRMPYIVIVVLVAGVPLSCGAASLVAGGAFYAFILSKMYEEYLEDYVYKLMAKVAAKVCRIFKKQQRSDSASDTSLVPKEDSNKETADLKAFEDKTEKINEESKDDTKVNNKENDIRNKDVKEIASTSNQAIVSENKENDIRNKDAKEITSSSNQAIVSEKEDKKEKTKPKCYERRNSEDSDQDLNNLNFHMMMFSLWVCVTLVNIPALLTWARNFKYSMVLKPDTSYHVGLMMSSCSACLWQMGAPKKNLKYYDAVAALLFITAVFIIVLGPFSLSIVNYAVTLMYIVITVQQLLDKSETSDNDGNNSANESDTKDSNVSSEHTTSETSKPKEPEGSKKAQNESNNSAESNKSSTSNVSDTSEDCACNEGRIYSMFKNLREKFDFSGNES